MLTENEVTQEALKHFRRLVEPGAHLRSLATHLGSRDRWGLFVGRNDFARPIAMLDASLVDAFAAKDWIVADGEGRARLGETGIRWYRRAMSPDPFRSQHQDRTRLEVQDAGGESVAVEVNRSESPLTWLRARRGPDGSPLLSDEQFIAGERLRRDFEQAQLRPHVTANWDTGVTTGRQAQGAHGGADISDVALAARQRVSRALDAVGPELADVLMEVCCLFSGITGAESSLGLPKRSGKVVLLIALNALARHYGLVQTRASGTSVSRHWSLDGYRPSLS